MKEPTNASIRTLLRIGFWASLITVLLGELPIGWVVYPESENFLISMLLGCRELSLLQLASGALFGGLFIPLHYYGFEALSRIAAQSGNSKSARIIHWGGLACAFWGGIVHVICVGLMFLCRIPEAAALAALPQSILDFTLWLVLPISVVFMPIYYAMAVAALLVVARGRTCLPRWAAVFNPLAAAVLLNLLPMIAPNTPLMNGLNMASMGIGSLLTFGGLLAVTASRPLSPASSQ